MRSRSVLTLIACWLYLTVTTMSVAAARPSQTVSVSSEKLVRLQIEGPPRATLPEAWQAAEAQAEEAIVKHFRAQGMAFDRPPTMAEMRPVLARSWKFKEDRKVFEEPVGQMMYWVSLEIPVTPELKSLLVQKEREVRVQARMVWLGKILLGVVVLLITAAGYFRLDEWTKGYYTTWLRVAAVGLIGTCALALFLFTHRPVPPMPVLP